MIKWLDRLLGYDSRLKKKKDYTRLNEELLTDIRNRDIGGVRSLLNRGAKVTQEAGTLACVHGNVVMLELLLRKNPKWDMDDLLQTAATTGDVKMCKLLIKHGANAKADDSNALVNAYDRIEHFRNDANGKKIVALLKRHGAKL